MPRQVDFMIPADTGRQRSASVWVGCPPVDVLSPGFDNTFLDGDDFPYFEATANRYKLIQADAGSSIAQRSAAGETGGILRMTTGATDENEVYISGGTGVGPCCEIANGGGDVWFECRVKPSQISDLCWAAGLWVPTAAAANEITDATGALADHNYVGWRVLASGLSALSAVYNTAAGGGETVNTATAKTLVAATWYKLGLHYDDLQKRIFMFVDGTVIDAAGILVSAANFPDANPLSFFAGAKTVTGTGGLLDIDWWRCVSQLTNR